MDTISPRRRSEIMARIRSKDTGSETAVNAKRKPRIATVATESIQSDVRLGALRAELRNKAQVNAEQSQLELAATVTVRAVEAFWRRIASPNVPLRPAPLQSLPLPPVLHDAAYHFGEAAATLTLSDAAYHLSLLYTGLLPAEWRARRGVFYTPPSLAERLLDQAEATGLDWSRAQVLDPAAGAGAFLVPAAVRMMRATGDCAPAIALQNLRARIRGYELDPFAAWLGNVFLEAVAMPQISAAGRRPGGFIEVRDSLTETGAARFDLVIGNPPFGRVSLEPEQRTRFARSLFGHANHYGLFLDLAVQLAKPGGLVSFLTPSSFLAGEYFKNLRALLWREAPPAMLDFVTPRKGVFEDVLQETVLATYRKGAQRAPVTVSFVIPQSAAPVRSDAAGSYSLPRQTTAPWLLPRHADEARLAKRLRSLSARLSNWGYRVSTGPLVWNRFKPQLRDDADNNSVPLVWAECVSSDGRFEFRSEKRNHKPYFRVEEGDEWMVVHTPCVLLQRTTAKEQARRLIAAELPASFFDKHMGITVENHLNMLIPITSKPAVTPHLLAEFLNTSAADRAFRCISGSVAVSAYELENLPLPDAALMKRRLRGRTDRSVVETVVHDLYLGDEDL